MLATSRVLLTCLTFTAACSLASCAEFFLSPKGDDAGPGTQARPWQTLAKANATVVAGDTVTLLSGEYPGVIQPQATGTKAKPITFRAAVKRGAILSDTQNAPAIILAKKQWIAIDGFHIRPIQGGWARIEDCEDVTIRNCHMEESRGTYVPLQVSRCLRFRLLGNVLTRQLLTNFDLILHGNMMTIDHSDRCIVQGNDFSKAGHDPAAWMLTTHDVIRGNVFHCQWGRNFELFNSTPCLFEQNVVMENYHGSGSADSGSKVLTIDGIWRHNLVTHNWDYVIQSASYKYGDLPVFQLRGTRFYNNTFACNAAYIWLLSAPAEQPENISGNVWKNNVFYRNSQAGGSGTFCISSAIGDGNVWEHNLICGNAPGDQIGIQWDAKQQRMLGLDLKTAQAQFPDLYKHNIDVDPRFVDAGKDDFRLQKASPCTDAGDFLTTVTEVVDSKRIRVQDARWFYDGFGIEGEQGDVLMVGPNKQVARVAETDREGNILTLDRSVTCKPGDTVSLPYVGKAPDLGAMEYGAEDRFWFHRLRVPPEARWKPPTDPNEPLVVTSFDDGDIETWGMQWYWGRFDIPGTYVTPHRVRDIAPDVRRAVQLRADQDNVTLEASIKPRGWDIDRYPWISFKYRIPAGVPVEAQLAALPTNGLTDERSVILAATPACKVSVGEKLIDDDLWHEAKLDARTIRAQFPQVKVAYDFRFRAPVKFSLGQEWWFTGFEIGPAPQPQR